MCKYCVTHCPSHLINEISKFLIRLIVYFISFILISLICDMNILNVGN